LKKLTSPLAELAWRRLTHSLIGLVLGAFVLVLHLDLGLLPAVVAQVVTGLLLTASWLSAFRFLMLDSWGRTLWRIVIAGAVLLVIAGGTTGMGFAIAVSVVTLILRRYRPWRHVPDRRRAVGFAVGLVAMVILASSQRLWGVASETRLGVIGRNLGTWSVWSLIVFWTLSLFHLAMNMRLHFLRLRPKLAVSAVLIGVVPLLLMAAWGVVVLYTTLGGARASRLDNTLESWRELAAEGADFGGALFDTTFVWPETELPGRSRVIVRPVPAWVPAMSKGMRRLAMDTARMRRDSTGNRGPVAADTTSYFLAGGNIWLMRWQGLDTDQPRVQAWQLGPRPLRKLSRILKAGLDISATTTGTDDKELVISTSTDSLESGDFAGLNISYRDSVDAMPAFWNKYLYFGGSLQTVLIPRKNMIGKTTLFIQLRVGWHDLTEEFLTGKANLNILVIVGLGVAALLFLVVEIFAVFFGVRISEGIVTGVHALHRGTRAVAGGKLDTVIEIPNEDEFGDLANSFNEMTLAVRHGREIALANERLTQELATARAIQVRLLPSDEPRVLDFEITGASIPSREIGGDYYDFLAQGEDGIGIAIGDVSGKGMPAALLMSNLQASLHGQVLHPGSVSGVVERVNNLLVRSTDPHMFATFFYGLLDASTATFTCTNAGHNPPLVMRNDGSMEELTTGGLLLGMLGEQPYQQDSVQLAPGEVIVMYTDGITEAVGPSAEEDDPEAMFGEEALREVVRTHRHLPATGIKAAILAAVTAHTSGVAQSDDITLVVIRRQG